MESSNDVTELLGDLDLDNFIEDMASRPITPPLVSRRSKLVTFTGREDGTDLEAWYTKEEVEFLGGLSVFNWIHQQPYDVPDEVWQLFCPGGHHEGWAYSHKHNWWYCYTCGNPRAHYGILFNCDSCANWYRAEHLPDRTFLCQNCN